MHFSTGLTVHRTFLQQTSSGPATKQTDTLQLILSQNAILDSAMDIVAYAKASLQLGMRLHFAFLATSLHIAYLALWEHMQTKQSPGRTDDTSRIEQSMNDILCVVERIHKSGDNAAMAEVVSAIKAMQQTPGRNLLTSVEPPLPTASPSEVCDATVSARLQLRSTEFTISRRLVCTWYHRMTLQEANTDLRHISQQTKTSRNLRALPHQIKRISPDPLKVACMNALPGLAIFPVAIFAKRPQTLKRNYTIK